MVDRLMEKKDYYSHYRKEFEKSQSIEPTLQAKYLDKFIETGWPKRSDENWRYANLKSLLGLEFSNYTKSEDQSLDLALNFDVETVVFKNGYFNSKLSQISSEVSSYLKLMTGPKDVIKSKTNSQLFSSSFYSLNQAFTREVYSFSVPDNVKLKKPVAFIYIYTNAKSEMYHPNLHIELGKNSHSVLLNIHKDRTEGLSLIDPSLHIEASAGAHCELYKALHSSSIENYLVANVSIGMAKDSHVHMFSLAQGGKYNRVEVEAFHQEEGSHLVIDGVFQTKDKNQIDYYSRIFHEKGHGQSHQLYKGVLDGDSTSSFDGLIDIAEDAQKVDSSQLNKNLLLSEKAKANTKPQLNVMADDVKAAHGATVSQLNDEEVFYLTSRGIPKKKAQKMIEFSFCNEVFLKIENLEIREWLKSFFEGSFK